MHRLTFKDRSAGDELVLIGELVAASIFAAKNEN